MSFVNIKPSKFALKCSDLEEPLEFLDSFLEATIFAIASTGLKIGTTD